jgi:hypothetical protein
MQKFVSLDFAQATHHFRARDTPHPPRKIIRADVQQAGDSTRSEPRARRRLGGRSDSVNLN